MGALQASLIVQFTPVAAIALRGRRFRQRQSTGQQQYSGQKTNAFFQRFLLGPMIAPSLTTIGLSHQFVHSNPVNCWFSVPIAHKHYKLAIGGKGRGDQGRVAGVVLR